MPGPLTRTHLLNPLGPAQWGPMLDDLAALLALQEAEGSLSQRRDQAQPILARIRLGARGLHDPQPDLQAHTGDLRQWVAEALLLWPWFGRAGGQVRIDTLGTQALHAFRADLPESATAHAQLARAAAQLAGWDAQRRSLAEARRDRIVANLRLKRRLTELLARQHAALVDRLGPPLADLHLAQSLLGGLPLRGGDLAIVMTGTAVFVCVHAAGTALDRPGFGDRPAPERAAITRWLGEMHKMSASYEHLRFPAFGTYHPQGGDPALLDALGRALADQGQPAPAAVVRSTLATMVTALVASEAEKFLVHDCWGHGWQESVCEFEWLFEDFHKTGHPLRPGQALALGEGPPVDPFDAFQHRGDRTVLHAADWRAAVAQDLRTRILHAHNAIVAEALADLVEHKPVHTAELDMAPLPSSSVVPAEPLRLDLSLQDCASHARLWSRPWRRFLGDADHQAALRQALLDLGRPALGLDEALTQARQIVDAEFGHALGGTHTLGADGVRLGAQQRLQMSSACLDVALQDFLERGAEAFDRARSQQPGLPRWRVPAASIDLVVLVLAWVYEQDRDRLKWHLDELLREGLWDLFAELEHQLRPPGQGALP